MKPDRQRRVEETREPRGEPSAAATTATTSILDLQRSAGNAAVARAMLLRNGPETAAPPAAAKPKTPEEVLKEVAESITEIAGTANAADKTAVVAEVVKIPLTALTALKTKGVKIVVCRNSVTEVRTDLKGVKPRGWPEGKSWDTVPGLNDPAGNRVIIATRGGKVPPTGDGHGAANLVLHEVGHAIGDAVTAGGVGDPEFIKARDADKAKLDSYEGQAGAPGVRETYAESFARFYSKDATDATTYPHLHAYWASNPFVAKTP